ncbi:hypothetical protein [Wolbachia endosymbiont (group A) of Clivina fossor]|uniref:hypothetical protein n=1 Tax=Wolbachia endosymbiont (group A) of Clivina fossor TaxID=3066133 RepID=UPI0031332AD2
MTSTKLERSRMRRKVSRTVLKSSEEGRPSSLRQQHADETSEEDLKKIIGSDVIIGRAYDELNQYNWSKEERLAYDQAKKRTDDYLSTLEEKLHEGILIGHQKGRVEGIQIGEKKGEKQAKIAVAKNLLKAGVSVDLIAKSTGLSQTEISQLKEKA